MIKEAIKAGKRTTVRITPTSIADMHEAIAILVRQGDDSMRCMSDFIRAAVDEKVERTKQLVKEQAAG